MYVDIDMLLYQYFIWLITILFHIQKMMKENHNFFCFIRFIFGIKNMINNTRKVIISCDEIIEPL